MYRYKINKVVSLFVIIIFIISALTVKIDFASAAFEDFPIENAGFEEAVSGDTIPGWTSTFPKTANAYYEVTSEKSKSGSYSLKIVDSGTAGSDAVELLSGRFEVIPGVTYTAEADMFVASGRTQLVIAFYDSNNIKIKTPGNYAIVYAKNSWQAIKVSYVAPPNAKYVRVIAFSSIAWLTNAYFDNFRIMYDNGMPADLNLSSPKWVLENQEFEVNLAASEVSELNSVSAVVYYDSQKIEVVDVRPAGIFSGENIPFEWNSTNGEITISATQIGNAVVNEATDIAIIRFKALSNLGDTAVKLGTNTTLGRIGPDQVLKTYDLPKEKSYTVSIRSAMQLISPGSLEISAPDWAAQDSEIDILLSVSDVVYLYGVNASVFYDPERLEVIDVRPAGEFAANGAQFNWIKTDNLIEIKASQAENNILNQNSDIAFIRFKVLGNAGNTEIRLAKESAVYRIDKDETGITYPMENDKISVLYMRSSIVEDMNGDNKVDLIDAVMVSKNIGAPLSVNNMFMDLNSDGVIDKKDVLMIMEKKMK